MGRGLPPRWRCGQDGTNSEWAEALLRVGGVEYEDPQACEKWVIKDACGVIAVRERDGKEVWGWFRGPVLALHFKKNKRFEAILRGRQLEWKRGAPSWIKK